MKMSASERIATRRRVLKGMLGGAAVTVGLPFLDCFLNTNGTGLAATGTALPPAFGTWFWALGLTTGRWQPAQEGKFSTMPALLQPLEPFKNKINLYSGMKVFLEGRPNTPH